jgi:hypothetical protein
MVATDIPSEFLSLEVTALGIDIEVVAFGYPGLAAGVASQRQMIIN